jgi:hypothetical protein
MKGNLEQGVQHKTNKKAQQPRHKFVYWSTDLLSALHRKGIHLYAVDYWRHPSDVLLSNNFWLCQLIRHFDDGSNDWLHLRIIKTVKLFKSTPLCPVCNLNRNPIPIRSCINQIFSATHQLTGIQSRSLQSRMLFHKKSSYELIVPSLAIKIGWTLPTQSIEIKASNG